MSRQPSQTKVIDNSPGIDLQKLADFVPTMIAVYSVTNGQYIYVNKAIKKLLGYTPNEFLKGGLSFATSLIHPDDLPTITKQNNRAVAKIQGTQKMSVKPTPFISFEYRMRHKKGHYIWLRTSGSVYSLTVKGHVDQIVNVSIDITDRKQKETELQEITHELERSVKERTEGLELALDASKMGLWERDFRTKTFTWSPRAKKLVGLKPNEEITEEKFYKLIHPDDMHIFTNPNSPGQRGQILEHRVIWPDGSVHWMLTQGRIITEHGVPIKMVGMAMNVDKLKKTQAELDASQQRYQAFISNSKEGIWRFEIDKPIPINLPVAKQIDLMYKYAYLAEANNAMAAMYGYKSARSLVGTRLSNLLIRDDPQNTAYLEAFISSGYNLTGIDSHELDRHGKEHYFHNSLVGIVENGMLVRAWGTQQDVTDHKIALQKLEESERRFRNMADSAPVFIWECNTKKEGSYYNKYWLEFTGRKLDEELGEGWLENVHPADKDLVINTFDTAFDARQPFTQEFRLRRHDGEYRWILETGVPRFSQDRKFLGYIGSCVDIEDLKHTKELEETTNLLRQQRAELLELNKAKDEFISLASHQLRTPATGVKQYLGMLLEGFIGSLTKDQIRMLKVAYESNERQLTIIDDLLRVAHVDAGQIVLHRNKIDAVRLIKDVIREQDSVFKKRHQKVKFSHSHAKITCRADEDKLRMVLENIIDNASKYTPESKAILVELERKKDATIIRVIDQGVGIAKKDITKLFQKFSRVENPLSMSVGGTGLGLYWAKKIIDLHGGSIDVTSRLNKGTVFTITIRN